MGRDDGFRREYLSYVARVAGRSFTGADDVCFQEIREAKLDRLAGTLRAKAIMEGKIRALTSQGKLQGLVVGALPLFMMLILSNLQHDAMMPLFHRWYGWVVLAVIFILELVGFMLIRKIVNIDV